MSIHDYLRSVQSFSRRLVKNVKDSKGKIQVNGTCQTVRYRLSSGDELEVGFPPEIVGKGLFPEDLPLTIVYEDEAVLVIDKPAGIATIPSFKHLKGTIANAVLGHYRKHQIPYTVHVVTRLDRDTSGLMLIAKHQYSHSLLSGEQKAGKVNRNYSAVVEGSLSQLEGTIDANIGRKEGSIIERMVTESGKKAITHYQVVEQSTNYSLVDIRLETGRTHQIRVHFAHVGHPLAGDDLYGGSTKDFNRQALHCTELTFCHPFTKKVMHFQSSPPSELLHLIRLFSK
ncbi:RNA pseudouridine synthase [Virgibacillus necropolis]|uniref:Pseudouridine synthase n=2 Tax=Virgibacillus necropolis TaxID=163877 RepID=A0A221MIE0_9BACI|nr:RNA pseudouridine synthase [Virgibacillus necropolis]